MFAILGLSLAALALVIERWIFFLRIRGDDASTVARVESEVRSAGPERARERLASRGGPLCEVLDATLGAWDRGPEAMEEAAEREGSRAVESLEARLKGLSVIAQTAPLLGLLGTVTGMIRTFMRIEEAGKDIEISGLASGIWEALLTTAFGLIVAIPALLAYHHFEGRAGRHVARIEAAARLLVSIRKHGGRP